MSEGRSDAPGIPTATLFGPQPIAPRLIHAAIWFAITLPALYQITLLIDAISGRAGYPYDLEWMEGGVLHHAQRIHDGAGIYVPPSIEFIPYLYTPLYPSLIALFGGATGVSYALGRAISVLSLIGIALVSSLQIASSRHQHPRPGPVWAGVVLGLGLFAAYYPVVEGWYDLVRADTLFLFLITAGIAVLPRWALGGEGPAAHARIAAAAAVLALAFFTKQTGVVYVAFGGAVIAVLAWRRAPIYVATAALIGGGGTLLLQHTTDGWFWTYASEIHRSHDFNSDRFWMSFGKILWRADLPQAPAPAIGAAITVVVTSALIITAITWWRRRELPRAVHPLLVWSSAYVVSIFVGAIGFGTEFAHFNAYMPAFLHGSLAAGAAVPAVHACARVLWGQRPRGELVTTGAAVAAALPLALACLVARWSPDRFVPTQADVEAGDKLIAHLRSIDGEVWMPSHPWYLQLAGKTPRAHRMGIRDVTWRQPRTVAGLDPALRGQAFAALVLDSRDLDDDLPLVGASYRSALKLPAAERPRLYTGAGRSHGGGPVNTPDAIWLPVLPKTPPPGAKMVFDFEGATWGAWRQEGKAWGPGPAATALPDQELVVGATGIRFATSMHGGDRATGRLVSEPFKLEGARMTIRLGGGTDAARLSVRLVVAGVVRSSTGVPAPGGDTLRALSFDIEPWRGKTAVLEFIDDSPAGHLDIDDVWTWDP